MTDLLDHSFLGFGVKLDAVAKLFKKKFACGSSVVKGENGAPDTVDVQARALTGHSLLIGFKAMDS